MTEELAGRVAVVTGAGGGIGLACVQRLRAAGASVAAVDLDVSGLVSRNEHADIFALQADLRDPDAPAQTIHAVLETFGRLDILVNNAGVAPMRTGFLATTDADWENTLEVNLFSYLRMAREAIPVMQDAGAGVLIHIASEAARMPNPRLPDYSVSKAAVLMLSKVLAGEFTSQGIRSNVVSPAFIRTPIYDRPGGLSESLAEEFDVDKEAALRLYVQLNRIPAGRLGTADEVAAMVSFLASDDASFISGANFAVDGGVTPTV